MKVPRPKIASVVGEQSLITKSSKRLSREIAAYLIVSDRTNELDSIMRDVAVYWAKNGVVEVNAKGVFSLSMKNRNDITNKIKQIYPKTNKVIINEQIIPSNLAGIKIELPNEVIDLSVRNKLNRFKQLVGNGKGISK